MDVTVQSVRGVRGATSARDNTAEAIGEATKELVQRMMDDNDIRPESIASIIFSVSEDLNAAFPAEAARELGLSTVPLLCTREIDVPGSLPRCIRVLMHVNTGVPQAAVRHVYLRDAQVLRPDLSSSSDAPPGVQGTFRPSPPGRHRGDRAVRAGHVHRCGARTVRLDGRYQTGLQRKPAGAVARGGFPHAGRLGRSAQLPRRRRRTPRGRV